MKTLLCLPAAVLITGCVAIPVNEPVYYPAPPAVVVVRPVNPPIIIQHRRYPQPYYRGWGRGHGHGHKHHH